jgi:hypothetical protein
VRRQVALNGNELLHKTLVKMFMMLRTRRIREERKEERGRSDSCYTAGLSTLR